MILKLCGGQINFLHFFTLIFQRRCVMLREIYLWGCKLPSAIPAEACPLRLASLGLSTVLSPFFFSVFLIFSKYLGFLLKDIGLSQSGICFKVHQSNYWATDLSVFVFLSF